MKAMYRLDGIITVVDAARANASRRGEVEGAQNESVDQLTFVDRAQTLMMNVWSVSYAHEGNIALFDTYTISLLPAKALQWKEVLIAGKREDMLIITELTLDIGKKLQSMPMQITNDPSIVSTVNVVVFAVPSFAHGQFLWPSLFICSEPSLL